MGLQNFSAAVIEKLGHYVYRLIDPRNGETFYVGKGQGNRIFQHMQGVLKLGEDEDYISVKQSTISGILKEGLQVIHVIHRHNISKDAIDEVEAALIDCYAGLSNIQGGAGSNAFGPMNITQINALYDLPVFIPNPKHRLLLININRSFDDDTQITDLYNSTRYAWRISKFKALEVDYVISIVRGVTKAVFIPSQWLDATPENFPGFNDGNERSNRLGFVGTVAPDEIVTEYVGIAGKRLDDALRHYQNPIRYWP